MDNSAIHSIRNSNSSFSASPQHPITPCSYTLSSFLELTNHNHSMNFTPPQAVSAYLNIYIYITLPGLPWWLSIKNLPARQETQRTWVWSLDWEGSWRWAWQPTPVFLPEESSGQKTLAGYSLQGGKESDTTEATEHTHVTFSRPGIQISTQLRPPQTAPLPIIPKMLSFFLIMLTTI